MALSTATFYYTSRCPLAQGDCHPTLALTSIGCHSLAMIHLHVIAMAARLLYSVNESLLFLSAEMTVSPRASAHATHTGVGTLVPKPRPLVIDGVFKDDMQRRCPKGSIFNDTFYGLGSIPLTKGRPHSWRLSWGVVTRHY
jgi:hypothetical protein